MGVRGLAQGLAGQGLETIAVVSRRIRCWSGRRHPEEFPAQRQLSGSMAVGEETEIADAGESVRQPMDPEAAYEFLGGKGHRLLAIVIPIILPPETNLAAVHGHQPVIGDGDTVCIAADIVENLSGSGKGPLRIDDPVDLPGRCQVTPERRWLMQVAMSREKVQLARDERLLQGVQEQPSEHA